MPTITAPNSDYTGVTAGVEFTDGTAEVDELTVSQAGYFARHGYTVEDRKQPAKRTRKQPAKD